jgi:polyisoprenoid-binding protein YceI
MPVETVQSTSGMRNRKEDMPRRSIDLDLMGEEFMLKGRFSDWESGLAFGPDLDRVNVRLAIDATSTSISAEREAADDGKAPNLFGFRSRDIASTGPGCYRATGTFSGLLGDKPMKMNVETPVAHSPLIVVTFAAKKQDFGDGWHSLIANVVPFASEDDGTPTRPAHAWLIAPSLAAA